MQSVGVRGRDVDLAVDKGFRRLIINFAHTQDVMLGSVDCLEEENTYRRIEIRSGILGLKYIRGFRFNFINLMFGTFGNTDTSVQMTRYPQRHAVDMTIVGANGQNGFLPITTNADSAANYISNPWSVPVGIGGRMTMPARYGRGQDHNPSASGTNPAMNVPHGHGSNPRYWQINENTGWMDSMDRFGNANFAFNNVANIYARSTNFLACLEAGRNDAEQRMARGMHLFYSDSNVVTFRFVFDILNFDTRILSIDKYTGGQSQS